MKTIIAALCVVAATAFATADTITLTTGEMLTGKIISRTDTQVKFEHPVLGVLTIAADKIKAPAPQPEVEAAPVEVPVAQAEEAKRKSFFDDWKARLEAGLTAAEGNSQYLNLYASFKASKETKRDRWAFDASYFMNQSDGKRSKDEFTTGLLKDWLLPDSPWLYFAQGRYDYDRFASYDQRVSAAGGVGYELVKTDPLEITLRAGLGASKEFGSDNTEVRPEGLLGADAAWKITDTQSLAGKTRFYPDLGDLGEFRWTNAAEWLVKIDRDNGVSFKLGAEHEHNSEVDPGVKHNDVKLYAALVWEF